MSLDSILALCRIRNFMSSVFLKRRNILVIRLVKQKWQHFFRK